MNSNLLNVVNRVIEHFERPGSAMGTDPSDGRCRYRVGFGRGVFSYCAVGCLLNDAIVHRMSKVSFDGKDNHLFLWDTSGSITVWLKKAEYNPTTRDWLTSLAREIRLEFGDLPALATLQELHDSHCTMGDHQEVYKGEFLRALRSVRDGHIAYQVLVPDTQPMIEELIEHVHS